jgi:hypothetical protein
VTTEVIHLLLIFGTVVVVPLTLTLVRQQEKTSMAVVVGVLASSSFMLDPGTSAALLTVPWLALACWIAVARLRSIAAVRFDELIDAIPVLYLVGGAGWLVIARYGRIDLGFGPRITELAAVHFHYAGYVASLLTVQLVRWLKVNSSRLTRLARVALVAVLAGTPLTAAGIMFTPALGAAGAALFTASVATGSALTLGAVIPSVGRTTRLFLTASALSIVGTIALAVAYSLGQWLGTPAPSLSTMAWSHGILNALAFALCGTLGWRALNPL